MAHWICSRFPPTLNTWRFMCAATQLKHVHLSTALDYGAWRPICLLCVCVRTNWLTALRVFCGFTALDLKSWPAQTFISMNVKTEVIVRDGHAMWEGEGGIKTLACRTKSDTHGSYQCGTTHVLEERSNVGCHQQYSRALRRCQLPCHNAQPRRWLRGGLARRTLAVRSGDGCGCDGDGAGRGALKQTTTNGRRRGFHGTG